MTKHLPARLPQPGKRLADEIEKRGWTQQDLARVISRPPQAISEIVTGKKQITPETALELGEAFGMSAEFWNKLEADYQLYLARKNYQTNTIARKSYLFDLLPIREMLRRRWLILENIDDASKLERALCRFLNINSIGEFSKVSANFKGTQTEHRTPELRAQVAWVMRVRNLAQQQQVADFHAEQLGDLINELLKLSAVPHKVKEVPKLLKDYGIKFVIVPHLSKTYLDGAAVWQDGHPVIALTLRHDRIDNFWFVLLHEIAHIYRQHPDVQLDVVLGRKGDENNSGIENEANEDARNWLINKFAYQDFVEETFLDLDAEKILAFSREIDRHPGIVVGRLQNDEALQFSEGRHFLEKVGHHLTKITDRP